MLVGLVGFVGDRLWSVIRNVYEPRNKLQTKQKWRYLCSRCTRLRFYCVFSVSSHLMQADRLVNLPAVATSLTIFIEPHTTREKSDRARKANVINPSQTFQLLKSLSRCQISRNIFCLSFNSSGAGCQFGLQNNFSFEKMWENILHF